MSTTLIEHFPSLLDPTALAENSNTSCADALGCQMQLLSGALGSGSTSLSDLHTLTELIAKPLVPSLSAGADCSTSSALLRFGEPMLSVDGQPLAAEYLDVSVGGASSAVVTMTAVGSAGGYAVTVVPAPNGGEALKIRVPSDRLVALFHGLVPQTNLTVLLGDCAPPSMNASLVGSQGTGAAQASAFDASGAPLPLNTALLGFSEGVFGPEQAATPTAAPAIPVL